MTGLLALHGGGEYVRGDEAAMDALVAATVEAASTAASGDEAPASTARIVVVPTAAARGRPDAAAANGERSFRAAASRAGATVHVDVASILTRTHAGHPRLVALLAAAHLVHFPGGDPDLIPSVFRDTPAWVAIVRAYAGGAVIGGASAGAMAMAERCWTPRGAIDGLGLLPGFAVLPHDAPGRLAAWRATAERGDTDQPRLSWLGLDEQTLVIGRPGDPWRVTGRGGARVTGPDGAERAAATDGGQLVIG